MNLGSFLYQFLVGGVIFLIGIVVPWRAGDYSWEKREDRRTISLILLASLLYLVFQGLWLLYGSGTG